jgi:hypothetical protein
LLCNLPRAGPKTYPNIFQLISFPNTQMTRNRPHDAFIFIAEMNFNEQHIMQTDRQFWEDICDIKSSKQGSTGRGKNSTTARAQQLPDHNVPGETAQDYLTLVDTASNIEMSFI